MEMFGERVVKLAAGDFARKLLSCMLSAVLCFSLVPATAFADESAELEAKSSAVYVTADADAIVRVVESGTEGQVSGWSTVCEGVRSQVVELEPGCYELRYEAEPGVWESVLDASTGVAADPFCVEGAGEDVDLYVSIPASDVAEAADESVDEPEPEVAVEDEVAEVDESEAATEPEPEPELEPEPEPEPELELESDAVDSVAIELEVDGQVEVEVTSNATAAPAPEAESDDPATWPDDKLVDTPAGRITMGEVRAYAAARDTMLAGLKGGSGMMTLALNDQPSGNYDFGNFEMLARVEFKNPNDPTSTEFLVTVAGVTYDGYCQDPGLPAPEPGWYPYHATWDWETKTFTAVVDCSNAKPASGQTDTGVGCQTVATIKFSVKGGINIHKTAKGLLISQATGAYSLAGATYGVFRTKADAQAKSNAIYILTTLEGGQSDTQWSVEPSRAYYVRELTAPTAGGYFVNPEIYTVEVGPAGELCGWQPAATVNVVDEEKTGSAQVVKTSANAAVTSGNTAYSLAGAEFGLYRTKSAALTGGKPTWTLTTKADGKSNVITGLTAGTYYLRETTAPKGFKKDQSVHEVKVEVGKTATVTVADEPETGSLQLTKKSSKPEITDGNPLYSFVGTTYGLYKTKAEADAAGKPLRTIAVDEKGAAEVVKDLAPGEYWVRELTAGPGYLLDKEPHPVKVELGKAARFDAVDEPVNDPEGIMLHKVKDDGQAYESKPGEYVTLALAEYTFDYYAGIYVSAEDAVEHGTIARTWVMRTNANGFTGTAYAGKTFEYDGQTYPYLVSGEVFRDEDGDPTMPLGTVVIHESKEPEGYKLSKAKFWACMVAADNARGFSWNMDPLFQDGNEATAVEQLDTNDKLRVQKVSASPQVSGGNPLYTLAGAQFDVYKDEGCTEQIGSTLTTGEDGLTPDLGIQLAPGAIVYVKEVAAPGGYKLPDGDARVKAVTVTRGGMGPVTFEYADEPVWADAEASLVKVDAENNPVYKGDATFEGAEYTFSFYAGKTAPEGEPDAVWVGTTNAEGSVSLTGAELVSGTGWQVDGRAVLPLGTLTVKETKAPYGYLLSEKTYVRTLRYDAATQSAKWSDDILVVEAGKTVTVKGPMSDTSEFTDPEDQKLAGVSVFKTIQGAPNEASPEGIEFEVVSKDGQVLYTLTLDAEGKASTGGHALPCGSYTVREVEESLPRDAEGNLLIQPWSHTSGTGSDVIAEFDLKDDGAFPLYEVVQTGCRDYTTEKIEVEKLDRETKEPVADTEFALYRYTGDLMMDDGAVKADASGLDAHGGYWQEHSKLATDGHGTCTFKGVPYGIWMLVETRPNFKYLSASETEAGGEAADPLATARIMVIDRDRHAKAQMWEDEAIRVETAVDKSTIDVTSAGLSWKTASEDGDDATNVGTESYRYDVSFTNGSTNTYADEYWVVDELDMARAPYDVRVRTLWTPVVENDTKPTFQLLVRTNLSAGESWEPQVESDLHQSTLCDGGSRFQGAGWRWVGEFASDGSARVDVSGLGLAKGECLTGVCLYYGAVEQGFRSTTPLSYEVYATHALPEGTVIPNRASSHITRNWAVRSGTEGGLEDDAHDAVETTVLDTFVQAFDRYLLHGRAASVGSWMPGTGDGNMVLFMFFAAAALAALAAAAAARRRACREGGVHMTKRSAKKGAKGLWCLLAACAIALSVPASALALDGTATGDSYGGAGIIRFAEASDPITSGCVTYKGMPMYRLAATGEWALILPEEEDPDLSAFDVDPDGDWTSVPSLLRFECGTVPGDVNGSGSCNVVDAQVAYEIVCGMLPAPSADDPAGQRMWLAADANGIRGLNALDPLSIQKAALGQIVPERVHLWSYGTMTAYDAWDVLDSWDGTGRYRVWWCPFCDCQVAIEHLEEMLLKGETAHSLTKVEIVDVRTCTVCGAAEVAK